MLDNLKPLYNFKEFIMNKKFLKFSLVLCASIFMAISCSSNSKPEEKKDWNGPTLTQGAQYNSPLEVNIPNSGNIAVEIPVSVNSEVKDVAFDFISGIEIDPNTGADKTGTGIAKIESKDIVANSFKYDNGKISFEIAEAQGASINERTMRLAFKVTSSTHKDYTMSVFVSFAQSGMGVQY